MRRRRARDRQAGLTLVELMTVVGLSSAVVLAAVSIHGSISDQLDRATRVSDTQQTLRAALEVIERYVRLSGRHLGSSGLITAHVGGSEQPLPVLTWVDGGLDAPDQLTMLVGSDVAVPLAAGSPYQSTSTEIAGDASSFQLGDLVVLDYYDSSVTPPARRLCVKQLTAQSGHGRFLLHSPGQSTLNAAGGADLCAQQLNSSSRPAYARLVGRGGAGFRINTTDDPRVPYLEMDPDGPLLGPDNGGAGYQRLASHVEDLQIAVQLARTPLDRYPDLAAPNEGWVNQGVLTTEQLSRVRNVRITLIARVPREEAGMYLGGVGRGERPAVENRRSSTAAGAPSDGYVRRRLETIVQVRNFGMQ